MPRFLREGGGYVKYIKVLDKTYKIIITDSTWEKYDTDKICDHISYWTYAKRKGKEPILKYGNYTIVDDTTETFKCAQCNKQFSSRSNYKRHTKSHAHKTQETQLQLCDNTDETRDDCAENIRVPFNTNNMMNNSNNTTNNIQINLNAPREFSKENPRWFTQEVFLDAIRDLTTAIPKLIKAKHFNDKYPENNNIRLGDRRDIKKRLKVYQDERWTIEDRSEVAQKLMYGVYDILDEIFNYFKGEGDEGFHIVQEELSETELHNRKVLESIQRSERAGRIISRVLDKWKNLANKFGDNDDRLLEKINDRFDTILLDNELKISQLRDKIQPRLE